MKKSFLIIALLLFPLFAYSADPLTKQQPKQQQWEQMVQQVDTWTDGLGMPIDPEIKETVIALNVLNCTTYQSCEGHLKRGNAYPWITFELNTPKIQKLRDAYYLVIQERDDETKRLEKSKPHLSWAEKWDLPEAQKLNELYQECDRLKIELQQAQLKHLASLQFFLDQFYQSHYTSSDRLLVLSFQGLVTLNSVGGEWQNIRSEEEKKAKLLEYQAEMKTFTAFLKKQFLTENK